MKQHRHRWPPANPVDTRYTLPPHDSTREMLAWALVVSVVTFGIFAGVIWWFRGLFC